MQNSSLHRGLFGGWEMERRSGFGETDGCIVHPPILFKPQLVACQRRQELLLLLILTGRNGIRL
jgi:hypothetical protein